MKQTSKYAIVFLAGAIFATAGSAYGAEAIKTISAKLRPDIKVSVNGKQLDASAISYNNTTYLPLRKAAEAVGGKIQLNGRDINIVTETQNKANSPSSSANNKEITNGNYLTLVEGAQKYGFNKNIIIYNPVEKTIAFDGTDIFIHIQEKYENSCDAFTDTITYVRKDIFLSVSQQLKQNKETDIQVIKNYYEGSDALIINGDTFITIVTGRNKYNLPNDFIYNSSLRTLGFKGLPELIINIDDRHTTNSTAFYYGVSNHVYVNESIFISIKNQLSE
ncbi:hypothetical protein B1A99_18570 [Cohnella sp. CIP 111063]|uniref:stalk domain-containing protein n=1 Tax=unclassified Cohnella TaxID=2636738 RepID=UPI000B8C1998|nr:MULTISPECIES: hypothetical protein [unclassified Cohnella]OXS56867.1 hypothetical protein B1A99_18570 [Cohnella sp. CIP 111063]PRX69704.1 hypothetical protein B0G52_11262 [Cohnella sp. SGD-V74]